MKFVPLSPQRNTNMDNYGKLSRRFAGDASTYYPCFICWRPVRTDRPQHWLFATVDGRYDLTPAELAEYGSDDYGFWPVGPDCLKQHPELLPACEVRTVTR